MHQIRIYVSVQMGNEFQKAANTYNTSMPDSHSTQVDRKRSLSKPSNDATTESFQTPRAPFVEYKAQQPVPSASRILAYQNEFRSRCTVIKSLCELGVYQGDEAGEFCKCSNRHKQRNQFAKKIILPLFWLRFTRFCIQIRI